MPLVYRESDNCSGHGCWPPRPPASWSSDVTANGLGVCRQGDSMQNHCCPPPCHGGTLLGSHSVTVNGRSIQVVGDPISCGSKCAQHSPNVSADG